MFCNAFLTLLYIFPRPTLVLNSVLSDFGSFPGIFIKVFYVGGGLYSFSIVQMFVYRYIETSPEPSKILKILFGSIRNVLIMNVFVGIYFVGAMFIPLLMANVSDEDTRSFYSQNYPEIYDRIKSKMLIGLKVCFLNFRRLFKSFLDFSDVSNFQII